VAYQSLYRRYRPQRFSEVRGQEHLVRGLQNAVREDRVGHAYLFSGPRGTGKTSTARILAKVLNCEKPVDGEPCGVCESCVAIEQGSSFDVHELDAASNNGVEAIRELISKAALGTPGRTKVYILDEVHMLSTAASNALLKILEEAPAHVVFILATTDPQKVLPTIRSRCQHFELHLLSADELSELAQYIVSDAGLDLGQESIEYAVRTGAGSARDMESALERVATAGMAPDDLDVVDELVEALVERDTARALIAVETATGTGRSPRVIGEQLIARLRDVFLAAVGADLSRFPDETRARLTDQGGRLTPAGATRAMEVLGEAFVGIQDAPDPRIPLEVALVRLTRPDAELSLAALADRIGRLEREVATDAGPATAPAPTPATAAPAAPTVSAAPAAPTVSPAPSPAPAAPDRSAPEGDVAARGGTDRVRPADGARQVLAQKKQGSRAPARKPPGPPSSPRPPVTESTSPPPPPPEPTSAPAVSAAPGPDGGVPTRDELTVAWGDSILAVLPPKAKTRYAGGRFVEVDGATAVFGLPNKLHAVKCEEVKDMVEAALAVHFGRAIPLRIVVDAGAPAPAVPLPEPDASVGDERDEATEIDLAELTDAHDVASTKIERVTEMFPGAELVEEE
jgi:DNA polymerase III subunit gamma/tau